MKAPTKGENGRQLRPRLVQTFAEGRTSYESCWQAKVMMKKQIKNTPERLLPTRSSCLGVSLISNGRPLFTPLVQGCTTSAMNGAAYNGHLEVVKWLHENRTEVKKLYQTVLTTLMLCLDAMSRWPRSVILFRGRCCVSPVAAVPGCI